MRVLEALGVSEWANEHEVEIVAAALDYALEISESQPETAVESVAEIQVDDSTSEPTPGTMETGGHGA